MPDSNMLDWKSLVQQQMRNMRVDPLIREEIIAELAGHLEETYENFCQQGLSKREAVQRSLEGIPWRQLSRKIQAAKCKEAFMNERTRQFWIPALASLTISEGVLLGLSLVIATHPHLWRMGPAALYGPWLLCLPTAGAAAAYLSRGAGSGEKTLLGAVWFPAIVGLGFICTGLLITLITGVRVFARPQWFYISLAVMVGVVLPGFALWLGSLPFLKPREATT